MSLFKKATASIALVALVSGVFTTGAFAANNPAEVEAANLLASQEIINNHSDNADAYNLNQNVLRQEIAAVARGVAGLDKKSTCDNTFADVSATTPNNWACFSVEAIADAGIVTKANANFNPERNISKAEALGMMVTAAGLDYSFDAGLGTSWQEQVVTFALSEGVITSIFTDYDSSATRGWVFATAVEAQNAADAQDEDDDLLGDLLGGLGDDDEEEVTEEDDTTDTVVSGDSSLTVTLSADTPSSATVPGSISGLPVAKFDFTAGSEDVTVSNLTLKRRGLSDANTLDALAIFSDEGRASKSKNDSQENATQATITLDQGGVVVKAGETVTLTVVADIAAASVANGDEFAIELSEVNASVDADGVENLVANTMKVGGVDADTLTVQTGGSVSNVKVGEEGVEIFRFEIKGDDDSDVLLKTITVKGEGTSDEEDDLANYALEFDGEVVSTVASANGKYVTFDLGDGLLIREDKTEDFTVTADILAGVDKTIVFAVDKKLDISAEGIKYGFGAGVAGTLPTNFGSIEIEAGELTLVDIDAPSDKIRADKKNVELGSIKVTNVSGNELELQSLGFLATISTGTLTGTLENVEAEINGTNYDLDLQSGTLTGVYLNNDLDVNLSEGVTTILFKADTIDSVAADVTLDIEINDVDTQFFVVETEDDNQVDDLTPSSLSFKQLTFIEASATASLAPLANVTVVRGSEDIVALQFEIEAEEASDIEIDEVVVDVSSGATAATNSDVSEVALYKGSVNESNLLDRVSGTQISATGDVTFNGFKVNVAADATETFVVTINVVDGDDVVGKVLDVDLVSVDAEDDENDDVTVSAALASNKNITVSDSGTVTLTADADNEVNEDPTTVLGGESGIVFLNEVKAQNEAVEVETVVFTYTGGDLQSAGATATLLLDDTTIATNANSDITFSGGTGTITFDNLTSLVIPEESKDLKLKINTQTIGFQKVGDALTGLSITNVAMSDADGVESGKTVTITDLSSTSSNTFDVVPATVEASVSNSFGAGDRTASLTFVVDSGDNNNTDNSEIDVELKTVVLSVSSLTGTGDLTLKNGDNEVVATGAVASGDVTLTISGTEVLTNGEVFTLETTADATYTLNKDGVTYDAPTGDTYTMSLSSSQAAGSYEPNN